MFWNKKRKDSFKEAFKYRGHTFYVPETPEVLEAGRSFQFWQSVREFQLHIRLDDLDIAMNLIKEANNEGDRSKVGYLVETVKAYRQIEKDERTTLNVGQQFIFVDKEPNSALTTEYKNLKKELYNESDEVKYFFLNSTWHLISDLLNLSPDTETEDFSISEEHRQIEQIFSNLIQGNGI